MCFHVCVMSQLPGVFCIVFLITYYLLLSLATTEEDELGLEKCFTFKY